MGWEDRPYYRDRHSSSWGSARSILNGSVPIFTAFNIRVRAHNMFLIFIGLVLVFGLGQGFTWQDRMQSMLILFGIVLLHEFGHCFAARRVGGAADEIVLTPLGGLAMTYAPRRAMATLITVAAGPAVNLVICVLTGAALWFLVHWLPWSPFDLYPRFHWNGWLDVSRYLYWIYATSYLLLLFNLLPIFPLDGGQMLQSILWFRLGYYRSTIIACVVGMIGSVLLIMYGLVTLRSWGGILLILIGISCFVNCYVTRAQLKAAGVGEFEDEGTDYSASLWQPEERKRARRPSRRVVRRLRRRQQQEEAEQVRIDSILAKVSAHGMQSLTWLEKRALRKATERQRRREMELSRERG